MQRDILKRGLELLGVRGMLLYTTTSMNPVENEAVVASVLKEAKGRGVIFCAFKFMIFAFTCTTECC